MTSLLLGLMAIIVTYNSNIIAKEQKQMSYYENTPDFHLSQEYKRDSTGYPREVAIKIAKFGGKAKNISLRIRSFAHFEIIDEQNNKLNKYIHLNGYFNQSYRTGENKGDIRLLKGLDNNKKFAEFTRRMNAGLTKKGYTSMSINALFIVKINYTDFLNNEKYEYYDISFADGVLIEKSDFRVELFENKKPLPKSIPITRIEDEDIENYLKIVVNKEQ
ncbi:hypothetical protein [Flavivirga aquatica]|nr:hypothetical protein [Flavivirga aquatica]